MKRSAYAEYADRSTGFVNSLPTHWPSIRLKYLGNLQLSNVDKKSVEGQEGVRLCNYMDVYKNERIHGEIEFMAATATQQQIERFSLCRGDVMLTKDSETPDDIAVPAVVTDDLDRVLCGYHLALLRPVNGNDGRYITRAISSSGLREQFIVEALGVTRFGLSYNAIGSARLPQPPPTEQRQIAEFLDRETDKIDRLIAEKEKLIGLLEEKLKAIISQAVTKGLNPDAKLRDSRIPWLGMIPEHWRLIRLRFLGQEKGGCGFPQSKQGCSDGELAFYKVKHLGNGGHSLSMQRPDDFISLATARELGAYIFPQGTVVFAKIGAAMMLNRFRLLDRSSCIDNNMMGFIPGSHQYLSEYAAHLLGLFQMSYLANPGAVPSLDVTGFRDLRFPVPDIAEQQAIIASIEARTGSIASTLHKCGDIITLLRERRAALISAAVTGQLDVRGTAE